eukprot:TRINITY_DN5848_c0_g1_i3.p1 TRINITY_DN5848_c0_g1~~TRINITY_DN5848_c0_g1_i3.p1  ORF type:complete len:426 (+),score=75.71 TRINITY_DN5848_c0_g1_i3:38-1315(+)
MGAKASSNAKHNPQETHIDKREIRLQGRLSHHISPLESPHICNYFPLPAGTVSISASTDNALKELEVIVAGPGDSGKSAFYGSCVMASSHTQGYNVPWYFTYRDLKLFVNDCTFILFERLQPKMDCVSPQVAQILREVPGDQWRNCRKQHIVALSQDPYIRGEFLQTLVARGELPSSALWVMQNVDAFADRIISARPNEQDPDRDVLLHVDVKEERMQEMNHVDAICNVRFGSRIVRLVEDKSRSNYSHFDCIVFIADLTRQKDIAQGWKEIMEKCTNPKVRLGVVLSKVDVLKELLRSWRSAVDPSNLAPAIEQYVEDIKSGVSDDQVIERRVFMIKQEFIELTPPLLEKQVRFYGPLNLMDPVSSSDVLLRMLKEPSVSGHFHSGLLGISDQFIPEKHLGNSLLQRTRIQNPIEDMLFWGGLI